jgi:hypothetical protein
MTTLEHRGTRSGLTRAAIAIASTAAFMACGGAVVSESSDADAGAIAPPPPPFDASGEAGVLDCSWMDGPNCWNALLPMLSSCVNTTQRFGTFSADRMTCTYDDGTTIKFDAPVPKQPSVDKADLWNLTIEKGGRTCLRLEEPAFGAMWLTTSAGLFTATADPTAEVTCPDGTYFTAPTIPVCAHLFPSASPAWAEPDGRTQLELTGPAHMPLTLFDCQ